MNKMGQFLLNAKRLLQIYYTAISSNNNNNNNNNNNTLFNDSTEFSNVVFPVEVP